jgi:hypothetical protein
LHPNPGTDPKGISRPDSTYTVSTNSLPNERKVQNIRNINDRNVRNVRTQNARNSGNVSTNRSVSSNRSGSTKKSNTESVRASNGSMSVCTNRSNRTGSNSGTGVYIYIYIYI